MSVPARKIVVTGGAGAIGSHLVDRLLAERRGPVVVFDNLSRGRLANLASHHDEQRLEVIMGDVRDADAVRAAVRGADVVYHLAAQSTVLRGARHPEETFTTNVVGTFNVLQAAAAAHVHRIVFASSREVYGEPIALPVDEDAPLAAINLYGASKAAAEAICRVVQREHALEIVILRFANVFGPRDFGRVIPCWLERAFAGHALEIYGGEQVLDFIWVGHAVDAFARAAALEAPAPPVNVASGIGTSLTSLAQRISCLAGRPGHVRYLPARPMEVKRFVANVERMRRLLRIEPPTDPLAELPELLGERSPVLA